MFHRKISATEDVSELAICNENDHKNLKQRLQQAELRGQEATLITASKRNY